MDGECTLALHAIPEQYRPDVPDPPAVRESVPIKVVFNVDELQTLADKLIVSGFEPVEGSVAEGSIDFHDPEGNVFQLTGD